MRSLAREVDPRIDFCTSLTSPVEEDLPAVVAVPAAVVAVARAAAGVRAAAHPTMVTPAVVA